MASVERPLREEASIRRLADESDPDRTPTGQPSKADSFDGGTVRVTEGPVIDRYVRDVALSLLNSSQPKPFSGPFTVSTALLRGANCVGRSGPKLQSYVCNATSVCKLQM